MAAYRYLAYDLVSNTLLAELPLRDVSFSAALNASGSFAGLLPLTGTAQTAPGVWRATGTDMLAASRPGRTVVYVERDGVLIDGYIIWTRHYAPANQAVQLGGQSIWSYFAHRFLSGTNAFVGVDQLTIAQTIINNVLAGPLSIGVIVGTETSGVLRDRTYNSFEFKQAGEAVAQLAAVANGFDFAIDVAYVAGVPTKTLRLSYPQRGRNNTANTWVFETGRNIIDYVLPEDATLMANDVVAIGAGDGTDALIREAVDMSTITAGWPLLQSVITHKDVSVPDTLLGWAQGTLSALSSPAAIPEVTVLAGSEPSIGAWIVGDQAKFVFGSDPQHPDARFPTRTELLYRIVGYDAIPGNEGQETVRLILN